MAFDANSVVVMGSRVPQILANYRAKATGTLSLTTNVINTVSCAHIGGSMCARKLRVHGSCAWATHRRWRAFLSNCWACVVGLHVMRASASVWGL